MRSTRRSGTGASLRSLSRRRLRLAGAYLVLLTGSHLVQHFNTKNVPSSDLREVWIPVVDHGEVESRTIRLAYRDTAPDSAEAPILLVHGSPGSSEVLRNLASLLSPQFRVIVPDLPGFVIVCGRPKTWQVGHTRSSRLFL